MIVSPHTVDLFEGTIRSNITMILGADDVPVTAEVLAASGADELLGLVDAGLDHRIQELGGNLSGGQRQRVALARALHADPQFLVLHEPTTAVDTVTEARIATGLQDLRSSREDAATLIATSSPAFLAVSRFRCVRPGHRSGPDWKTCRPPRRRRRMRATPPPTNFDRISAKAYRNATTRWRPRTDYSDHTVHRLQAPFFCPSWLRSCAPVGVAFVLLIVAGMANTGAGLVGPWAIGRLVDELPTGAGSDLVIESAIAVAIAGVDHGAGHLDRGVGAGPYRDARRR